MNYKEEFFLRVNKFFYKELKEFKMIKHIILTDGTAIINSRNDINNYEDGTIFRVKEDGIIDLRLGFNLRCIEFLSLTNGQLVRNMNYELDSSESRRELISILID